MAGAFGASDGINVSTVIVLSKAVRVLVIDHAGAMRPRVRSRARSRARVQKKTRKTRQADIDLAAARYGMIGEQR
jgi:hypothetical protein